MDSPQNALREKCEAFARDHVEKLFVNSKIGLAVDALPKFDYKEIKRGKVLGKGGFSTVYEIRGFNIGYSSSKDKVENDYENDDTMESRQFIANHCLRDNGDARYAVKKLSPDVVAEPKRFVQGAIDCYTESRFLSEIQHPNIIRIRGVAKCDPFKDDYFIVLDRLYDTLEARLETWNRQESLARGFVCCGGSAQALEDISIKKLQSAFDLAAALDYLHKKDILYRDLKPENIGFDIRDDVKIFDFGLAREIREDERDEEGLYNLTSMTGSLRYMAPEVANGLHYNNRCDVYSFSILLWQIYTCVVPYELYTPKTLREKVYNGAHKRPPITPKQKIPDFIAALCEKGWHRDIMYRPSMAEMQLTLRHEYAKNQRQDSTRLNHDRRRSTFVFKRGGPSKRKALLETLKMQDLELSDDE